MKEKKLNELYPLFLEFLPLFHQKIGSELRKNNDKYKCNKNQHKTIMVIGNMGKITPTVLGKYLDLKKGSLTTLIDSLEKMNLLERHIDPNDRRKTLLQLTKEGKNYFKSRNEELEKKLQNIFMVLTEEELDEFMSSLKNVVETLKTV
ncbi:MarR family transcriptional regulator [Proteiniborus sp.]|uniref:MarR family winged helix-turn-helix transcriptional regulator n=1 Tax=Proteiniborus sp. TaxID=2079015 RepID=UPI0033290358